MQAQAAIQLQSQQASMQMQMEQQAQMMQQQPQGAVPGSEAPQQGMPMPSDQAMGGQGFNAGSGGTPPQGASPELTQAMRP